MSENFQTEILIAEPHGFCGNGGMFGVSGAIRIATQVAAENKDAEVYILGDLVHNNHVTRELEEKWLIKTVQSLDEIPSGQIMVVKSHGLAPQVIAMAEKKGLQIVDATCPMVKAVHLEVKELAKQGKKIIYLASDLQHDEAVGVYGEAPEAITLITVADLPNLIVDNPSQTVILTQTTLSLLETKDALEALRVKYPEITIKPHICMATTQRQEAVMALAKEVDLMVIVGSKTSSNSNRLREVAEATGTKAVIVDNADELDLNFAWSKMKRIGVSSGASTPETVLNQVIKKLKELAKNE